MKKLGVGVIGCGNISDIYLQNCSRASNIEVVAVADKVEERARAKAAALGIGGSGSVEELLQNPSVDIVLNLTVPKAHLEVSLAAIGAGKHVYSEKPLGISRQDGKRIIDAATSAGVLVGCAPDTFLGAGIQTCRKLIDDGAIGRPIGATAFMVCHGHESWHPDPAFYYELGGGPMLDMGPYYMTALVALLGPVLRVAGMTSKAFSERVIGSEPKRGTVMPVETPTHINGLMEFSSGAVGTILTSFDVWSANLPLLEIYGTEGSLSVPDPNTFGGPVRLWREGSWQDVGLTHAYPENSRGLGVADLAAAVAEGREPRASGALAFHVLDVMEAFGDASDSVRYVNIESGVERPAAMPGEACWL